METRLEGPEGTRFDAPDEATIGVAVDRDQFLSLILVVEERMTEVKE